MRYFLNSDLKIDMDLSKLDMNMTADILEENDFGFHFFFFFLSLFFLSYPCCTQEGRILYNFGLSECNKAKMQKELMTKVASTKLKKKKTKKTVSSHTCQLSPINRESHDFQTTFRSPDRISKISQLSRFLDHLPISIFIA